MSWYILLFVFLLSLSFISSHKEEVRITDWSKVEAELDRWLQCRPLDRCNASGRPPSTLVAPSKMTYEDFIRTPCFCDEDCLTYGDCCLDAAVDAWNADKDPEIDLWKCEKVMGTEELIYMVSNCPSDWKGRKEDAKCRRKVPRSNYTYDLDIPVFSNATKRVYSNMHCAFCHRDVSSLLPIEVRIRCPPDVTNCYGLMQNAVYMKGRGWVLNGTDLFVQLRLANDPSPGPNILHSLMFSTRKCRGTVIKNCDSDDETNPMDEYYCKLFASYVSHNGDIAQYNNPFCAKCNGTPINELSCNISITAYHDSDDSSMGISFALLFDFFDEKGEIQVGMKPRCPQGELFNPETKQCVILACGLAFAQAGKDQCLDVVMEGQQVNNGSCPWVLRKWHEFDHFENGSIYEWRTKRQYESREFDKINDTTIILCERIELLMETGMEYVIRFSALQTRVSTVCLSMSIFCLAFHILVHGCVSKLRNLPGKNLLSLASMLFIAQLLFLGVNRIASPDSSETSVKNLCRFVAITLHFTFLSSFFWMNVMAVDICRIFTAFQQRSMVTGDQNYRRYAYYAWGFPALIVICAFTIDVSNDFLQDISPSYGSHNICWIMNRKGLLIFFVIPIAIILIENIVFFSLTAREIYRTKRAVEGMTTDKRNDRVRFLLYTKLAFIMGLSWILGFIASFSNLEPLWYAFIVLNGLQGVFIFLFFTLKKKVILAFRDHFCRRYRRTDKTKKHRRSRSRERKEEQQKLRMCSSDSNLTALVSLTSSNQSEC